MLRIDRYRMKNINTYKELFLFTERLKMLNEASRDLYMSPHIYDTKCETKTMYIDREFEPENKNLSKSKVKVRVDKLENIGDLIRIIENHPLKDDKGKEIEYNMNMKQLHHIRDELKQIDSFIGMKELKTNILNQLLYFIQGFQSEEEYMHMILFGPPGTGKTEIAMSLGKMFCKLGILKKETFRKVVRSDLIAGYLGQTALKTAKVIEESKGGVLFIDEVYALGHRDKDDLFSKECIDTLCESLSACRTELMVIIAGYEEDVTQCFLKVNKGLDSRFPWKYTIKEYTSDELHDIFVKKVDNIHWILDMEETDSKSWFKTNKDEFKYFGRDIETFLTKLKVVHSKRMFVDDSVDRKRIIKKDMDNGMELFKQHRIEKEKKDAYLDTFGLYT